MTGCHFDRLCIARWCQPPFENQTIDDDGARDLTFFDPVSLRSDVDQQRAVLDGGLELIRTTRS